MKMMYRMVIGLFLVGGISLASDLFVKEAEAHCTFRHIFNHCSKKWFGGGSGGSGGGSGGGSPSYRGNINGRVYGKFTTLDFRDAKVESKGRDVFHTTTNEKSVYQFCGGNVQCLSVGTYSVLARKEVYDVSSQKYLKMGGQTSGVSVSGDTFTNADIAMCLQTDGGAAPCTVEKPVRRY